MSGPQEANKGQQDRDEPVLTEEDVHDPLRSHRLAKSQRRIFRSGDSLQAQIQRIAAQPLQSRAHLANMDRTRAKFGYDIIGPFAQECVKLLVQLADELPPAFILKHIDQGGGNGELGRRVREHLPQHLQSRYLYESHDIAEHVPGETKVIYEGGELAGQARCADATAVLYSANQMSYTMEGVQAVSMSALRCLCPQGYFLAFNPPQMWDKGSRYYHTFRHHPDWNSYCQDVKRWYWNMGRGGDFMILQFQRTHMPFVSRGQKVVHHPVWSEEGAMEKEGLGVDVLQHAQQWIEKLLSSRSNEEQEKGYEMESGLLMCDEPSVLDLAVVTRKAFQHDASVLAWLQQVRENKGIIPRSDIQQRLACNGGVDAGQGGVFMVAQGDSETALAWKVVEVDECGTHEAMQAQVTREMEEWKKKKQEEAKRAHSGIASASAQDVPQVAFVHHYIPIIADPALTGFGDGAARARRLAMSSLFQAWLGPSIHPRDSTSQPEKEAVTRVMKIDDAIVTAFGQDPAHIANNNGTAITTPGELAAYIRRNVFCYSCRISLSEVQEQHPKTDFRIAGLTAPFAIIMPHKHQHEVDKEAAKKAQLLEQQQQQQAHQQSGKDVANTESGEDAGQRRKKRHKGGARRAGDPRTVNGTFRWEGPPFPDTVKLRQRKKAH